jgi:hypothetical protein
MAINTACVKKEQAWKVMVRSEAHLDVIEGVGDGSSGIHRAVRQHSFELSTAALDTWADARISFEVAINPDMSLSRTSSLRRVTVVGFGYEDAVGDAMVVVNALQWEAYRRASLERSTTMSRQSTSESTAPDQPRRAVLYVKYADDIDVGKTDASVAALDVKRLSTTHSEIDVAFVETATETTTANNDGANVDKRPATAATTTTMAATAPGSESFAVEATLQVARDVLTAPQLRSSCASQEPPPPVAAAAITPTAPGSAVPLSIAALSALNRSAVGSTAEPQLYGSQRVATISAVDAIVSVGRSAFDADYLRHTATSKSTSLTTTNRAAAQYDDDDILDEDDDEDETATVQHSGVASHRRPPSPTLTAHYDFMDQRPPSPGVLQRNTFEQQQQHHQSGNASFQPQQRPFSGQSSASSRQSAAGSEMVVYTTATGNCYHHESCRYRPARYMSQAAAQLAGLRACGHCGGHPFRRQL